ncbi:MAG: HEAT repeat domain-containing protein [Cyanobacteria bacterium J06634_6]
MSTLRYVPSIKGLITNMSVTEYSPPVSALLNYGRPKTTGRRQWLDYIETYGLTDEHIPELIQLAIAEDLNWDDELECYAPIHAYRALGQLKAEAAIRPLIGLLDNDDSDWFMEDLPIVFGMIGAASIPALNTCLNSSKPSVWTRVAASSGLEKIASRYPECRDDCVALLTKALSHYQQQLPELNGSLVGRLLDLQAVESVDVIEQAYKKGPMDEMVCGSWARVQIELGLATADDFTVEELQHEQPEWMTSIRAIADARTQLNSAAPATRKSVENSSKLSQFGKGNLSLKGRKASQPKSGFGSQRPKERKPKERKKRKND